MRPAGSAGEESERAHDGGMAEKCENAARHMGGTQARAENNALNKREGEERRAEPGPGSGLDSDARQKRENGIRNIDPGGRRLIGAAKAVGADQQKTERGDKGGGDAVVAGIFG